MSGADLLLAAILITTPPGTPETSPPPADKWPALRDAVHQLAVEWEILDPRETRYVLTRPEDFCPDLNMLRRRYRELEDAPKVADGLRFPEREAVNELVRFNRSFRKKLDERQQLEADRAPVLQAGDPRDRPAVPGVGRGPRRPLRVLLRDRPPPGPEEAEGAPRRRGVRRGDLPPNVPTWRFNELK
jgi:hypothetical protein